MVDLDDDVWSIPSEPEGTNAAKSNKSAKQGKSDDAAASARKAERERESLWRKETAKASRFISQVNSVFLSLSTQLAKSDKNPGALSEDMLTGLKDAHQKLSAYKTSI